MERRGNSSAGIRIRRRTIYFAVVLVTVLIFIGLLSMVLASLPGSELPNIPRALDVEPRMIAIWTVYPDETVGYTSIFHITEEESGAVTEVAGPLVSSENDVISTEAIGGSLESSSFVIGPDHDVVYQYELLNITRDAADEPYGLTSRAKNSPYLADSAAESGNLVVSLGTTVNEYFAQSIVAVVLPKDVMVVNYETAEGFDLLLPYRRIAIGSWIVYYFDVTDVDAGQSIQVTYTPGSSSDLPELDIWKVERKR